MTSDTLRAACKRLSRFISVVNDATSVTLKESRNSFSLAVDYSKQEFMLGFAEISSFSHAFKRWTGKSPTDYRLSG